MIGHFNLRRIEITIILKVERRCLSPVVAVACFDRL